MLLRPGEHMAQHALRDVDGSLAFSVKLKFSKALVYHRNMNQYLSKYWFKDGSILEVYDGLNRRLIARPPKSFRNQKISLGSWGTR